MKIFAISDMHGNLDGINPSGFDIVIIAGDFSKMTGFGKWHMHDQKKWIEKKFFNFSKAYPDTEFIIIPGNHDLCLDNFKTGVYPDLDWNIIWPRNCHLLINSGIEIQGLKFWGSPNIPIISYKWAFESESDILKREFSKIPMDLDFLITHTPPRIPAAKIDISLEYGDNSQSFGSYELADAIFEKKPKNVICGHIHSGCHSAIDFNGSICYNVSRLNESYNIGYEPLCLDF